MEMSAELHTPAALSQEKEPPLPHWIEGLVSLRTGLDVHLLLIVMIIIYLL
jgi:hypothetical protein